MRNLVRPWIVICAITAITTSTIGCAKKSDNQPSAVKTKDLVPQNYLPIDAIAIGQTLPMPPAQGSMAASQDLNTVLNFQQERQATACTRANSEVTITLDSFFGPAYGPLTAAEVKNWKAFFKKIQSDVTAVSKLEKAYWNRPRPYLVSNLVHPCVSLDDSSSYPSGHSTIAHVFALILSDMRPANAAQFSIRADQIAQDRVIGGVHFPTDIAAGQTLATQIYIALLKNPVFIKDLQALN